MERLIDVLLHDRTLVHTYPVTADGLDDAACRDKAAKAAAYARLVPEAELADLTTRIHVERGGPLAPYGDRQDILSQTRKRFEQSVRERAYLIWQQEDCPAGAAHDHWCRAREHYLRERAYHLWELEGRPEGQADQHWHETCELEAL